VTSDRFRPEMVYKDERVMKPNGDFVWWKRLVRDPIANLTERLK